MIPLLPPLSAVATSQSTIQNSQDQSGALSSSQTLNVVDLSDSATATATSTGNAMSGAVETGTLDVQSTQSLSAGITATTALNVTTNAATSVLTTAATGNTGDTGSYGGGALTGTVNQTISANGAVTATSQFSGPAAAADSVSGSTQAIGNSHGVAVSDTSAATTIHQTNNGATVSNGFASLQYTAGSADFASTSVANNVTGTGTGAASQTLTVNQTANAQSVAGQYAYIGNGQTISAAATATADNLSVTNENGPLTVTDDQVNTGYIQAQGQVSSAEFGSGQASGYAVGNSALVGDYGPTVNLNNTQSNSATIEAQASYSGGAGYDAYATSTVMGNAVTGYACSDCSGTLSVTNTQSNSGALSATSQIAITGSNRSVNAAATAVGNTATFYVSKPTH